MTEANNLFLKKGMQINHLALIGIAIVFSWTLWSVFNLPVYLQLSGGDLICEVLADFGQQIIETTVLLEISLLYIKIITRALWHLKTNLKNIILQVIILAALNGISSIASGTLYTIMYPDEEFIFAKIAITDYIDLSILSTACLVVFLMNRYRDEEVILLQTKLKTLSLQTNNHFVFNCFTTLSSLISTSPQQADSFLQGLSRAYRYLVAKGSKSVVPLSEEIAFVKDYALLIEYRYSGIEIMISNSLSGTDGFVCPVSLQSSVENAIKHNRHGVDNHLLIELYKKGDYVFVTNNIMPRADEMPSTKSGLHNLVERYSLLTKRQVNISDDNGFFSVGVPILGFDELYDESINN